MLLHLCTMLIAERSQAHALKLVASFIPCESCFDCCAWMFAFSRMIFHVYTIISDHPHLGLKRRPWDEDAFVHASASRSCL